MIAITPVQLTAFHVLKPTFSRRMIRTSSEFVPTCFGLKQLFLESSSKLRS